MSTKKPNLLFVFADQWRRQAVGFMNEDNVITPNIDNFAKESLAFDNAISCFPLCSPHRAALLTGKYPLSTGMFTNCKIGSDVMLSPDEICIADVLKESNYDTGYIGKWHLDLPELNVSDHPVSGARKWDAYTPPGPKRHSFDFWYSYGADNDHLNPHYWKDSPEMIKVNQWSVEHETDVAIDYIKNHNSDKPFALFVSWNPPHSPYDQVPEKYKNMYKNKDIKFRPNVNYEKLICHTGEDMGKGCDELTRWTKDYFAAVTGIDENFGRLMEELEKQGLKDDTIVVLSADHGDMMGSHGMMAKHVWYEESIGIPFIIRWPDKIKTGREKTILNSADVMPTLLSLMNLQIPDTVEGADISPAILGQEYGGNESAFICACPGREEFLKEFEKKEINPMTLGWRGVRTSKYTYVIFKGYLPNENTKRLLYDNEKDPYQMNPLCIENIEENQIAEKLEKELRNWLKKLKDPFLLSCI